MESQFLQLEDIKTELLGIKTQEIELFLKYYFVSLFESTRINILPIVVKAEDKFYGYCIYDTDKQTVSYTATNIWDLIKLFVIDEDIQKIISGSDNVWKVGLYPTIFGDPVTPVRVGQIMSDVDEMIKIINNGRLKGTTN